MKGRRLRFQAGLLLPALLGAPCAFAIGTSAGVDISNTASVEYSVGTELRRINSNTATFRVDEKIDLNLTWQDSATVHVSTPDSARVLTFVLTNTGNGSDSYSLSVQNTPADPQFAPAFVDIYLDTDGDGVFDPAADARYVPGSNDPALPADGSLTLFVRNHIPAGLSPGQAGNSRLIATSNTGSGAPGTAIANAGDNATTAVIGTSGGSDTAAGTYEVRTPTLSLRKSVEIHDPLGGNQPMPGAAMAYTIEVTVPGPDSANGLVITDPIPSNTTYSPGTLTLNGTPLTDQADADAGDVGATRTNTVTVNLGDLAPASPVQTIRFEVIIH